MFRRSVFEKGSAMWHVLSLFSLIFDSSSGSLLSFSLEKNRNENQRMNNCVEISPNLFLLFLSFCRAPREDETCGFLPSWLYCLPHVSNVLFVYCLHWTRLHWAIHPLFYCIPLLVFLSLSTRCIIRSNKKRATWKPEEEQEQEDTRLPIV